MRNSIHASADILLDAKKAAKAAFFVLRSGAPPGKGNKEKKAYGKKAYSISPSSGGH